MPLEGREGQLQVPAHARHLRPQLRECRAELADLFLKTRQCLLQGSRLILRGGFLRGILWGLLDAVPLNNVGGRVRQQILRLRLAHGGDPGALVGLRGAPPALLGPAPPRPRQRRPPAPVQGARGGDPAAEVGGPLHVGDQASPGSRPRPAHVKGRRRVPDWTDRVVDGGGALDHFCSAPRLVRRVGIRDDAAVRVGHAPPVPIDLHYVRSTHHGDLETALQQHVFVRLAHGGLPAVLKRERAANLSSGLLQVLGEGHSQAPLLHLLVRTEVEHETDLPDELVLRPVARVDGKTGVVPDFQYQLPTLVERVTPAHRLLQHDFLAAEVIFLLLLHLVVILPDLAKVPANDAYRKSEHTQTPDHTDGCDQSAWKRGRSMLVPVAHRRSGDDGPPEASRYGLEGALALRRGVLPPKEGLRNRIPGTLLGKVHQGTEYYHAKGEVQHKHIQGSN
mmetsp:Transcript_101591/g.270159  ORF Transcript_101591/g.270159 Transcript_101591/m.270159 type:complete len:450 (+) Transcript_101591:212-1561(+)